ncbi:MAG: hypothetical protein RLY23_1415 [Actinomycetota bacterium]
MTLRSVNEAKAYLILLVARLGGIALGGIALALGSFSSQLPPLCVWVFLSSFLVVMLASTFSVVAGALRKERSKTLSERMNFYFALSYLEEAAAMVGAQPSSVRRWTRALILVAVLAIVIGAASSAFSTR